MTKVKIITMRNIFHTVDIGKELFNVEAKSLAVDGSGAVFSGIKFFSVGFSFGGLFR